MWGWLQEEEEDGYDDNSNSYSFAILDRILAGGELSGGYGNESSSYGEESSSYGGGGDTYDSYKSKTVLPLDYTILSYGIFTLYLILVVESARHYIDHAAHGRPFFKAVLLMVYSELATLGIVEFGLFLWGKYGTLDKVVKTKFADVHFALFFTALFNAFQYSLTSIASTRFSNGQWVHTEQLELDHYVEIREEYDRVDTMMGNQFTRCGKVVRNCLLSITRPGLRRRYESLRVQIRFHELRLYLLESHNLPLNIKVSDYLKRSELSILIGLVHVSATAWVLLIGGMNLFYFTIGMVGYTTANISFMSSIMSGYFFLMDFFFIAISYALRWKMHYIFQKILKMKIHKTSDWRDGIDRQRRLFWFGSPPLVISMIQLMNFGYAVSFSVIIIYWKNINTSRVHAGYFLIFAIGCYFIFLYNLSCLLPEYTLCTSLGYLTNKKELQETVAMHRLEEAERQQRQRIIENAFVNATSNIHFHTIISTSTTNDIAGISKKAPRINTARISVADLVNIDTKNLRSQLPVDAADSLTSREERMRQRRLSRKKSVSDGVALMRALHGAETVSSQEKKENTKRDSFTKRDGSFRRPRRTKTMSQPGIIQGWQNITEMEEKKHARHSLDDMDAVRIAKKENKNKSRSDPRIIQSWQDSLIKLNPENSILSNKEGPTFIRKGDENKSVDEDLIPNWKKERANRLAARKQSRKKTQSASAVIQTWQDYAVHESAGGKPGTFPDENYNSSDLRALSSDEGASSDESRIEAKKTAFGEGNQSLFIQNQLDLHTLRETDVDDQESSRTVHMPSEVTFTEKIVDLSDAVLVNEDKGDNGKNGIDDDGDTVDTNKSIGNLSDIDCVEAEAAGRTRNKRKYTTLKNNTVESDVSWRTAILRETRLYFSGPTYPYVSHVLGTSIVFYLVGHRVQFMIAQTDLLDEAEEVRERTLFLFFYWLEVTILMCFMVADFMIFFLFPLRKCRTETERRLVFATVIDIFIVGSVLVLFVVAEAKRCCIESGDDTSTRSLRDLGEIGYNYDYESECTCTDWGTRTYSGIGMIEPFTSLICLRLFRFRFAHLLVRLLENDLNLDVHKHDDDDDDNHGGHTGHGDNYEDAGTALELWERAIAEFPDIVEKYGQFSGELLQAMLGLQVAIESTGVSAFSPEASLEKEKEEEKKKTTNNLKTSDKLQSRIKLSGSRFAKLNPRAQGIVIAGKLGQPVKPMQIQSYQDTGIELSTVTEGVMCHAQPASAGLLEFEVDVEQMDRERNTKYTFVAPFARLVRSMRRCDRRHLPLLKEWISVDVVMTQFEIVYFEAIDIDSDYMYSDIDHETKIAIEACRSALQVTKGGKNLRLCDVAKGRKVVGHLDFDDVTEVHVAKDDVPISDMSLVKKAAALYGKDEDFNVEHWSDIYKESDANQEYARIIRWTLMQEERLKLSTTSGTLFFRFYSDLAYFEAEKSGDAPKNLQIITKDIAFQWAETVSRICGRDQLEQTLPHFGENNDDELRDYLEVIHFHEKEAENERRSAIRGRQGVGNVEVLFHGNAVHRKTLSSIGESDSRKTKGHRPNKSMIQYGSNEMPAALLENKKAHRRVFSSGGIKEQKNNGIEESNV